MSLVYSVYTEKEEKLAIGFFHAEGKESYLELWARGDYKNVEYYDNYGQYAAENCDSLESALAILYRLEGEKENFNNWLTSLKISVSIQ